MANQLTRLAFRIEESSDVDVIVVCVPRTWKDIEDDDTYTPRLDLRRLLKALCLKRGIPTQIIRERNLAKTDDAGLLWNLGLAFYTKALNTPWTTQVVSERTVFAGLGFAFRPTQDPDTQIALGCSHLFDKNALGIDYLVTKLREPTLQRGNNPHFSRDDAQRFGERIVNSYFQSHHELPERVVVHRNTPYLDEEMEGLLAGLHRVQNVDLLQIRKAGSIRGLASKRTNGGLEANNWPISRGTNLILDDQRMAIWLHGSSSECNKSGYPYNGQRIPKPLIVKRYHGSSSADDLAEEILALSKMNWNSTVPYAREPVTLTAAREIARIGALVDGALPTNFDYRLFI